MYCNHQKEYNSEKVIIKKKWNKLATPRKAYCIGQGVYIIQKNNPSKLSIIPTNISNIGYLSKQWGLVVFFLETYMSCGDMVELVECQY